jgi:DNA-binding Lrp family transcriptional regulator
MDDKKNKILDLLWAHDEMFTLEIAKILGLSAPTTSKYLEILKAEGKITNFQRLPYVYWKINKVSKCEKN